MKKAIFFEEHKLRLVLRPGTRPGKAIRRLYRTASAGQVQDLVALWTAGAGEYCVEVVCDEASWIDAYRQCRSCMRGEGARIHQAYRNAGAFALAIIRRKGKITARALISPNGLCYKAYGDESGRLLSALAILLDCQSTPYWLEGVNISAICAEFKRLITIPKTDIVEKIKAALPDACYTRKNIVSGRAHKIVRSIIGLFICRLSYRHGSWYTVQSVPARKVYEYDHFTPYID